MSKYFSIVLLCLLVSSCACRCKYNEYIPENNPLIIPDDLKSERK